MKRITNFFERLLLFSLCLMPYALCHAQMVSPDVKCVTVLPNGDVTLTWIIPPSGNFVSYHVDTSSNPAIIPFTLYSTVTPYASIGATHFGANANAKRMYYRVETEYNPGNLISLPKDTFSTMFLTVANISGDAFLTWNKISNQPIPTSSGWYKIYREYPLGNWALRDSTQSFSYNDIIDVCSQLTDGISYRVEISDNTGCTSVSNIAGATGFTDITPPTLAPIDTVSVDTSGNQNRATISWEQSPSPDADSIVIYTGGSTWNAIDTVPVLPAFYTYTASVAGTVSEMFRIAFLDSCGNISPMGTPHKTIYLSATFDICAATASLKWNKYINMSAAVTQYQLFTSVNAGPFTLLATNSVSDTDYVDTGLALGSSYCYIIRAANINGKTSSSNKACFIASVSQPPQFNYNRFATVLSDNSIQITAHVDTAGLSARTYNLLRATGTSGNFSILTNLAPPVGTTTLTYIDTPVAASANRYSYKWEALDSCAHIIMTSNLSATMLLKASITPNLNITLTWNNYGNFLGNVDHYEIYQAVDGVWNTSPIGTVPPAASGGTYTDDVSFFMSSKGVFSYKVVAIEGSGNPFLFADSSVSNIAKVYEYPKIYVPNAFTPNEDNLNDIFIPIIGFIEPGGYTFTIFDNTGTPVMHTNNPAEGWDGKKKGHNCPEGAYMYLIQCKASNGDDSQISGTVSLIR